MYTGFFFPFETSEILQVSKVTYYEEEITNKI